METAAAPLPLLTLHQDVNRDSIDPRRITKLWLEKLQEKISHNRVGDVSELFLEESWWRDIVAVSWNIKTKKGTDDIGQYLQAHASKNGFGQFNIIEDGALQPRLSDLGGLIWVESGFTFETKAGKGRGIVRLANVGPLLWKAWIVHTNLDELKGFPEQPPQKQSNSDQPKNPQVLIIGAGTYLRCLFYAATIYTNSKLGQSGLMLGARLKALNVSTLIVDKSSEIGNAWRMRYDVRIFYRLSAHILKVSPSP